MIKLISLEAAHALKDILEMEYSAKIYAQNLQERATQMLSA